jgi:hypothetical protein
VLYEVLRDVLRDTSVLSSYREVLQCYMRYFVMYREILPLIVLLRDTRRKEERVVFMDVSPAR